MRLTIIYITLCIGLWMGLEQLAAQPQGVLPSKDTPAVATPPSDAELLKLLGGDSESRLRALRFTGPRLAKAPAVFFPALAACGNDPNVEVRRNVVIQVGQFMIWTPGEDQAPDPRAIDFLLEKTRDEDYRVAYNCIYYGLSTLNPKSDGVIDRMLDVTLRQSPSESWSLHSRLAWGCRGQADQTAARIQKRLDQAEANRLPQLGPLAELHFELVKRFPRNLDRFDDQDQYVIIFAIVPPFFPNDAKEIEQHLRQRLGDSFPLNRFIAGIAEGEFCGALVTTGIAHYATALHAFADQGGFKALYHFSAKDREEDLSRLWEQFEKQSAKQSNSAEADFAKSFRALYEQLGREYPNFELKRIDWAAVGQELLPRSETVRSRAQFCLLCQELVARLEDSHALLHKGTAEPAYMPMPRWDPGFACLIDDQDRPVVYHVDAGSPAETNGIRVGMAVTHVNERPVNELFVEQMNLNKKYVGYSSERYLRYQTAHSFVRQMERGTVVKLRVVDVDGQSHELEMPANLDVRYLPRLPVPIDGIKDSANVSWKRLDRNLGYLYVRRISNDLPERLDEAIAQLKDCDGLVIDVRGNSGGGFDTQRALRNFDLEETEEPERPRFKGPIAVLIDSRCISAGEGWTSWFQATKRAKLFGEATAGASSRKKTIDVLGGLYQVTFSVKAYTGFLDRPIERRGLEPDFPVRPNAQDLANRADTVLKAACEYLLAK